MFLADTIDGLESSAVRKDEKTETIMMMEAEVKFQDSGSPSEEDLVKNLGKPGNEKPMCKEVERDRIMDVLPEGRKYMLEEWKLKELPEKVEGFPFEVSFCKTFMTKRAQVIIFRVENLIGMDLVAENVY